WPTGGEDSSATDAVVVRTAPDEDASATHAAASDPAAETEEKTSTADAAPGDAPSTSESAPVGGSIESVVAGLLELIDSCQADQDAECAVAVVSGAGGGILERLGPDGATRDLSLIEDYGDIAVLRLGRTEDRGEQMIVIVRQDDEWLVRDVYDVADQPSEKG